MCFVTAASAGLAILGAATTAIGTIQRGEAEARQASYRAQIARNNAKIAEQYADAEIKAGVRTAEMKSLETASRVAKVKAAQAASGVDITTGSAVDVQASERSLGKVDTETEMNKAQLKAYGFRSRAVNEMAQAGLYDAAGSDALTGSYLSAGGTLLSKASSLPTSFKGIGGSGPSTELRGWSNAQNASPFFGAT